MVDIFLGQTPDGTIVFFRRLDEEHRSETLRSMRLYVGTRKAAVRANVHTWSKHRGTLKLNASEGTFTLTAHGLHLQPQATWNGEKLEALNLNRFDLEEGHQAMCIHSRR